MTSHTRSLWHETTPFRSFPSLNEHLETEICVVGAGIAGLTTAYLFAREGHKVTVVADGLIGDGETGRTTAHLASALDDRFFHLETLHGVQGAKLAAESHSAAIQQIGTIIQEEEIDCDFRRVDGFLFLGAEHTRDLLQKEYDAARRAGLDVMLVDRIPLNFWDSGPALQFANQAQFHPLKYLDGLVDAILHYGGSIHTQTHVTEIQDRTKDRGCMIVTEHGYTVTTNVAIVCTNTPVNDRVTMHTKQAPYRTYAIGMAIPRGSIPHALYWDTLDPYHYVRVHPGNGMENQPDILIVGGEDHKTGQAEETESIFQRLEAWTRTRFPMVTSVISHWSGQVWEPVDSLGFLGKNPGDRDVYIATGDSGHGMTHGTLAGMIILDLVEKRENPWAQLYDPGRVTLRSAGEFVKENVNVAKQYVDWITSGDEGDIDAIPQGSGAVLRRGTKKVAVYKDDAGEIHVRSAVCPHLYCIVGWNDTEKSWDCPCHGSRFDAYGKVINGPAVSDLPEEHGERSLRMELGLE